ncbi:hypothetical protein CAAN1_27S00474 [[Candida] anglica]|uniref:Uncharacterized protein n=1 Tax=[Candida] anglica TaxID=148631 RepID=A0ABP0E7S0_9ASCO
MVEPVLLLPTKCVVDQRLRLRATTKHSAECLAASDHEAILKIKMAGISFNRDFELFKLSNFPGRQVVPGNKIVGRLQQCSDPSMSSGKYLLFPYSNCLSQRSPQPCENCTKLKRDGLEELSSLTYRAHSDFPCLYTWEYGLSLDGGLQDFVKIRSPRSSLIRVGNAISLHDCCFLMDLALPLFSYFRDIFDGYGGNGAVPSSSSKLLIVLNDTEKEANDILVVLKHFQVTPSRVKIVDSALLSKLTESDKRVAYKSKFNHAFVFNVSDAAVELATLSVSTGLQSTRSRYSVVLFDQYNPHSLLKNKDLDKQFPDFTVQHFRMSYKDRLNAEEIIDVISQMNIDAREGIQVSSPSSTSTSVSGTTTPPPPHPHPHPTSTTPGRPSVTSIDTTTSTYSSSSLHSNSTSYSSVSNPTRSGARVKVLRFRDEDSIIDKPIQSKPIKTYSWLWYERDFNLCDENEHSDDDNDWCNSVRQINRLIRSPNHISRVCYTKRTKQKHINALLF